MKQSVCILGFFLVACLVQAQQVTTVAGSFWGYADGMGTQAQFKDPTMICADNIGNIFVADKGNNRIRKITPQGEVSTLAGNGLEGYLDDLGTAASFAAPNGICIDTQNNLYVTDFWNFKIRKITPEGMVTTVAGTTQGFADGDVSVAQFGYLGGICIDAQGNLYVADGGNNKIRKITPQGMVSTYAGSTGGYLDGQGTAAKFSYPSSLIVDNLGNFYITDTFNRRIRKIDNTGYVSTVAGSTWGNENGQGINAKFDWVTGICIDAQGNLFITDANNHNIRKIDTSGYVSTYAGSTNDVSGSLDGDINTALFCSPAGIMTTTDGTIYVSQGCGNPSIRKITSILNIENFVNNKMVLYPNPTKSAFTIEVPNTPIVKISIYDMVGKLVYVTECINNEVYIEDKLNKGVYFVQLFSEKKDIFTSKLIVE